MVAVLLVLLAVALIVWRGRGKPVLVRGQWRVGAGLLGIGVLFGAAFVSIHGDWQLGLGLLALSSGLLFAARTPRGPRQTKQPASDGPTIQEARAILGVDAKANEADIRAAYSRLMRLAHPDRGGSSWLAAQLNAARDRLLKT